MLATNRLDYDLPPELIATRPAQPRDSSRLLVVSSSDPARIEHRVFRDLPGLLRTGDRLVFNTSHVLPARLIGNRRDTGGRVSGLFLSAQTDRWIVALRANGRLRSGQIINLCTPEARKTRWSLRLVGREGASWLVEPIDDASPLPAGDAQRVLAEIGTTPLPPYILHARTVADEQIPDATDRSWYQTVYADAAKEGSVAAPTAGLHFTPTLLDSLGQAGIGRSDVVLHVGPGTFKPVDTDFIEQHPMHSEWCHIPPGVLDELEQTRATGGRIIPVGTTSARAIESVPRPLTPTQRSAGWQGETDLLITPGTELAWTDGLITNFHLPRSTLLALVATLLPGGPEHLLDLYRLAIAERYRFYSYGDAMLILA